MTGTELEPWRHRIFNGITPRDVQEAGLKVKHGETIRAMEQDLARRSAEVQSKLAVMDALIQAEDPPVPVISIKLGNDPNYAQGWQFSASYYKSTDGRSTIVFVAKQDGIEPQTSQPHIFDSAFGVGPNNDVVLSLGDGRPRLLLGELEFASCLDAMTVAEIGTFLQAVDVEIQKQEATMSRVWPALLDDELNPYHASVLAQLGQLPEGHASSQNFTLD